ncbi:hypothetical protein BDV10DRAFT_39085 [Aspergillus recurvatus]
MLLVKIGFCLLTIKSIQQDTPKHIRSSRKRQKDPAYRPSRPLQQSIPGETTRSRKRKHQDASRATTPSKHLLVERASQHDGPSLGLATVNIAHDAAEDPAPNLHVTSQASADYSREASTDPASTFQEVSARPADAQDDDRKTFCDHPITVSLAVEFVHKFSQQLYETPGHVYAEIVCSAQKDVAIQWSDNKVWEDTIRVSFFKSHKHTIFKLLEYIGASEIL